MNRVVELYEANHLIFLLLVIFIFGVYILSMKNKIRNIIAMCTQNEDKEDKFDIIDRKITNHSIVKLKFILTGELLTCDFTKDKSKKYIKPRPNIKRFYFDNPLTIALFDKEVGDIIKYKVNEFDEKDIYVEVLNVNNTSFTDEENEFYRKDKSEKNNDMEKPNNEVKSIKRGTICNSKDELIALLNNWLETNENTIGDLNGRKSNPETWIWINIDNVKYRIPADCKKDGIKVFLNNESNNNPWELIPTKGIGNNYKLTNDVKRNPIRGFYMYLV